MSASTLLAFAPPRQIDDVYGGGGGGGGGVTSVNGASGAVTIDGAGGIDVTTVGQTVTIASNFYFLGIDTVTPSSFIAPSPGSTASLGSINVGVNGTAWATLSGTIEATNANSVQTTLSLVIDGATVSTITIDTDNQSGIKIPFSISGYKVALTPGASVALGLFGSITGSLGDITIVGYNGYAQSA